MISACIVFIVLIREYRLCAILFLHIKEKSLEGMAIISVKVDPRTWQKLVKLSFCKFFRVEMLTKHFREAKRLVNREVVSLRFAS